MRRNDILWKGALEDLFDDFLRFFYPDADRLFDMKRGFEYLDKELEQLFPPEGNEYALRYVDKLVKVFTSAGHEEWILVHIEVQGYSDKEFARRMFQYYYRILDKYDKPITAFAIFADESPTFHPKYYEREYLGTKVYYSFNTFKLIEQADSKLEASNNPFAMAVLSAKLTLTKHELNDDQLFNLAFDLAKRLLKKQMPKNKVRNLLNFLRFYINFESQSTFTKFDKELATLTERTSTMGIEELLLDRAEKKGIKEGREKTLKEIIAEMKRNGLDIDLIARITGLSIEDVEKLS
jgi:predicted transposase YdaD